jgi:hypothetical protein
MNISTFQKNMSDFFRGLIFFVSAVVLCVEVIALIHSGQEKAQAQPRPVFVPPFVEEEKDDDFRGCLDETECLSGEFCFWGQCMNDDPLPCKTDNDCLDDEYCFEQTCEIYGADDFVCRDNTDCFEDEWCWEGECTTEGLDCTPESVLPSS